jgi:hypothetical protein
MRVGRVVGMVVGTLRRSDALLEARHRDAVHAGVAVHPDVAGDRLEVALDDEGGELVAVAQDTRDPDVDVGVLGGVRRGLRDDAVGQDTREEEVRRHDDPPGSEQPCPLQRLRHRRPGEETKDGSTKA